MRRAPCRNYSLTGYNLRNRFPGSRFIDSKKQPVISIERTPEMRSKNSTKPSTPTKQTHFNLSFLFRRNEPPPKPIVHVVQVIEVVKPVFPQEIHDYILLQLEALHRNPVAPTCSTCLLRDFSSYSKVCKEWHIAAVPRLYVYL